MIGGVALEQTVGGARVAALPMDGCQARRGVANQHCVRTFVRHRELERAHIALACSVHLPDAPAHVSELNEGTRRLRSLDAVVREAHDQGARREREPVLELPRVEQFVGAGRERSRLDLGWRVGSMAVERRTARDDGAGEQAEHESV